MLLTLKVFFTESGPKESKIEWAIIQVPHFKDFRYESDHVRFFEDIGSALKKQGYSNKFNLISGVKH
jgi:hypothetical protein